MFNYDQFGAKFPYTVPPNLKLIDANEMLASEGLRFMRYDLIELDSSQDTGVQGASTT